MSVFVRQISVLSVLWAMCELLLPEGRQQRMVRMTASLLVMAALLSTVGSWLGNARSAQPAMTQTVQQTAEDTYRRTALVAFANQLESYCVRVARRAGYQAGAEVYLTLDGELDHVKLTLNQPEAALISSSRLAQTLSQQLGVDEQRIWLSVEGT